jgi:hypothetical protein
MPDVRQLNLLDGFHMTTVRLTDDDAFPLRAVALEDVDGGYRVRLLDGPGLDARCVSFDLGGRAAAWLIANLQQMIDRFQAENRDD